MKKEFKTLAEFKRLLKVGEKLNKIDHQHMIGRDAQNKPIYGDREYPTREISIVQTNSFALKTENTDLKTGNLDGTYFDSWCQLPKASLCRTEYNRLIIMTRDTRGFNGMQNENNPSYKNLPLILGFTYWFAE